MSRPIALVTGGARGLGAAIAADLSADHDVAVSHRAERPELPPDIVGLRADLADPDAPARLVAAVVERFGRIDLLVNNAGITGDTPDTLQVNLRAPMALLEAALPHMEPGAAVVNVGSVNARLPARDAPVYSAAKAGLANWTRQAAKRNGPRGIRVNAVAPGAIEHADTPRDPALTEAFRAETALGRLATARDVAAAIRFLAGDTARAITGTVLDVCGGYRL